MENRKDSNASQGAGASCAGSPEPLKVSSLEQDIKETVVLMKANTDNVLARGDKIDEMELQAEELTIFSQDFRNPTDHIKWRERKNACKQHKNSLALSIALTAAVILIIILVSKPWLGSSSSVSESESGTPPGPMTSPSTILSTLRSTTTTAGTTTLATALPPSTPDPLTPSSASTTYTENIVTTNPVTSEP